MEWMGSTIGTDGAPHYCTWAASAVVTVHRTCNDDAGERVAGIVDWVQGYREAGTVTLTSRVPSSVVESP